MSEATEKILGWAEADARVDVNDDGTLTLRGDPPITVTVAEDDERVVLAHAHDLPGAGAAKADAAVRALGGRRGTLVEGSAKVTTAGVTITLESPIFLDGLNRDSFSRALQDLAAETDTVLAAVGDDADTTAEVVADDTAETAEEAAPTTDPDDTREVERVGAWTATHEVPAGGMSAWARPDPSLEPSAQLQARVHLAIAERRGDWARVVGSNGWSGWVDARRLQTVGTVAAKTATASPQPQREPSGIEFGGFTLRPLPLVGGAVVILSAFLPWTDTGLTTADAFDIPLPALFDYATTSTSPELAWFLLAIGIAAVLAAALPNIPSAATKVLGLAALVSGVAFIGQAVRFVSDFGGSAGDAFSDVLGFGAYVAIGGGAILLASRK
jgi:hypothetical protein